MFYTVLMGDLEKSRQYSKGIIEAQDLMRKSLLLLNRVFKKNIKKEARIQRGDEFQVLMSEPCYAFMFYRVLELLIYPLKMRCAMCNDAVYDDNIKGTDRMYGNAYFEAGSLLELCKAENKSFLFGLKEKKPFSVNAMINHRKSFSVRGSSIMNNHVEIIAELLYPLTYDDEMNVFYKHTELIKEIFEIKQKLYAINNSLKITSMRYFLQRRENEENKIEVNFDLLGKIIDEYYYTCSVHKAAEKDENYLSSCWKRGFNTRIAEVLGVQRQTVDRAVNYLNLAEKRNYDGVIIFLLKDNAGDCV